MSCDSLFMVKTNGFKFPILQEEVKEMNPVQTGKFIAELRKEHGFTQEDLGERIGVTNKTISRWETGVYLPPADMLLVMSELFDVSINELLTGNRLTDSEYKKAAEKNLAQAIGTDGFSLKDKITFFKNKWLKEHIAIMVFIGICIIGSFAAGLLAKKPFLVSITPLLAALAHAWRHNAMMTYVEYHAYDETGN